MDADEEAARAARTRAAINEFTENQRGAILPLYSAFFVQLRIDGNVVIS